MSDFDELLRNQRPPECGGERVSLFIQRIGLQSRQNVIAGKFLTHVEHVAPRRPSGDGTLTNLIQLRSLPQVERDGDDLRGVLLLQPRNCDRRIEPA
jgi:hypothetical protein